MSYPHGPDNPYGNNPYGQQQPPQQPYGYQQPQQGGPPTYGYPQQPPQHGIQPTYGYPQQGQQGPYGGAPAGVPGAPPSKTNAARIMMIIGGGIQTVLMLFGVFGLAFAAREFKNAADSNMQIGIGLAYILVALFLIIGVAGVILGVQFPKGGNSLRIISIVWGVLIIICGLVAITTIGVLWVGLGGVIVALLAQPESTAYFNRPDY